MAIADIASTTSIILAPQAMTNSATATANYDTRGGDYASVVIALASEINTNAVGPTLSLLESDDTVVTNFATFDSDFERSAESFVAAKAVKYGVDLRGRKRYLRLSVTTGTATNDDVTVSAIGVLSRKGETAGASDFADVGVAG